MINLSITWWELALLIIAIAFVVGIYFLVKFLKKTIATLNNVNILLTENKRSIDNIISNVDTITTDSSKMSGKADNIAGEIESTVTSVKADVVNPLIQVLATLVKVLSTSANRKSKEQESEQKK